MLFSYANHCKLMQTNAKRVIMFIDDNTKKGMTYYERIDYERADNNEPNN